MRAKGSAVVPTVREYAEPVRAKLADLLDALADGEEVQLGEFGDAGSTTDADEQAGILREVARAIR